MNAAVPIEKGQEAARGEYIAFLDPTDRFVPQKIQIQLTRMQNVGSLLSHTSYHVVFPERFPDIGAMFAGRLTGHAYPQVIEDCPVVASTVMINRYLVDAGFAFPEDAAAGAASLWISVCREHEILGVDEMLSVIEWSSASDMINIEKSIAARRSLIVELMKDKLHNRQIVAIGRLASRHQNLLKLVAAETKGRAQPSQPLLDEALIRLAFPTEPVPLPLA